MVASETSENPGDALESETANQHRTVDARLFPVVGVGASAGGLEALSDLLAHFPSDLGMAIVIIQHLDPQHETVLSSLLARDCALPVIEATEGLAVEANKVYVIPKNKTMTLAGGALRLVPRAPGRGPHLPIDAFFRSLAEDRPSAAIGVILSGTGSDGTLGLETLREAGGITIVQDEASAKFPAMAMSALASGCVDLVLTPESIARELVRLGKQTSPSHTLNDSISSGIEPDSDEYRKILSILRTVNNVDFSAYRETTLKRRILRRMLLHGLNDSNAYIDRLGKDRAEVEALFQDILIKVTSFFREPETFQILKERVFPEILKLKTATTPIRIWVPGCSTGQEAYSLAIALTEFLETQPVRPPFQIFGTDLSESVSLAKARRGIYPESIEGAVSPERLKRFFTKESRGYRINKELRDACVFARQDVTVDPPFSRVDLVSCRNVLIYLTPALQRKVIHTFHFALNACGFLLLGSSETSGSFTSLFRYVDSRCRLYVKNAEAVRQVVPTVKVDPLLSEPGDALVVPPSHSNADWMRAADSILLREYAPPGALINDDFDILQFRGNTGDFLSPPPGEPNHNLLRMARQGLMLELRDAVDDCRKTNAAVRKTGVRVGSGATARTIDLRVLPVKLSMASSRCYLVLFEDKVSASSSGEHRADQGTERREPTSALEWIRQRFVASKTKIPGQASTSHDREERDRLQREIAAMREYMQTSLEQHEATLEELRSANEEILSSNEELQTSKQEFQSVNQELMSVNEQLNHQNVGLNRLSNDMNNLLSSVNVAVVTVGTDCRIRRYTPAAERVLKLGPGDIGRPISEIGWFVGIPDLEDRISSVVVPEERELRDRDGRWHLVTIRPYRTAENKIDGAVIVIADIDDAKNSRQRLQEAADYAQSIVDTVREPMLILTENLRVVSANESYYRTFARNREEIEGKSLFGLFQNVRNLPGLKDLFTRLLIADEAFDDLEVTLDLPDETQRSFLLYSRPIRPRAGAERLILFAMQDVTGQREAEASAAQSTERFRFLAESIPLVIFTALPSGTIDSFNHHWAVFTGLENKTRPNAVWADFVHPDDLDETERRWHRSATTGAPFQLEHRFRRADGVYCWHLSRANALRDDLGNVMLWAGSSTEIEDQKQTEQLLRTADDYKNEFLAMLAHELRNPLAAISSCLALLEDSSDSTDHDWAISTSMHQIRLLNRMIEDLLDTSRINRGTFRLRREIIRPAELIESTVVTVQHLSEAQRHFLRVEVEPDLPEVNADPARIEQVLFNLLTNSLKFTPQGGTVALTATNDRGDLVIKVKDTGIGVDPSFLPAMFDAFAQADQSLGRGRGGLGIGLTLVKAIVEMHGGTVEAKSEGRNKGTEIILRLPSVGHEVVLGPDPPVLDPPAPEPAEVTTPGKRILIVEDNLVYARGLRKQLESAGHHVSICGDGVEALEAAPALNPDVIVLDLGLPGMDGFELAKRLREIETLKSVKVIVVSGYACEEDRNRSRAVGVDEHLAKPVLFTELLRVVNEPHETHAD